MGKTKKFIIITLSVIVLGILTWRISRPSEPTYKGKKLNYWLQGYDNISPYYGDSRKIEADAAILHIGTNAVPTLLRMLRQTDSPMDRKFAGLLQKQSLIKFDYAPASLKHHRVENAFYQLKNRPESAIPSLIEIYDQKLSFSSQYATANILGLYRSKAKAAIPSLLQGATSTNTYIRASAIEALTQINKDPFLVMPILFKNRRDPNTEVRSAVQAAFQIFDSDTSRAITALFESLNDPNETIRRQATNSLKEIYPEYSVQAGWK